MLGVKNRNHSLNLNYKLMKFAVVTGVQPAGQRRYQRAEMQRPRWRGGEAPPVRPVHPASCFRGLENDVFFQVGLLTTIGLSAKNAILIAEFAKDLEDQGRALLDATLEATRMRLRPILMTSLAFGLGVTPLMLSSGAGSGARNAIGTGVFGGITAATVLAIFFIPLFYVVVRKLSGVPLTGKKEVRE